MCNGSTADSDSVCWGSNPYSAAIKETSFVYHDKRGFFLLSGQNTGAILKNRASERSIGYSEARFFAFSSKRIPKSLLYK